MNSRRLIRSPHRRGRAACPVQLGRAPLRFLHVVSWTGSWPVRKDGLVRQLRSMRSTATSALIGILGSIATPPHRDRDEGRGAAATRLILVLRPIWWKSVMAKLSLRSWHLEQSQHRTNGVPKWTCREGWERVVLTENDPRVSRRANWRSSAGEPIDSRRDPILQE